MEVASQRTLHLLRRPKSLRAFPTMPPCSSRLLLGRLRCDLRTRRLLRPPGRTPHKIASVSFHSSSSSDPLSYRVEIGHAKCCTSNAKGADSETSPNKFLQVVLVSPMVLNQTLFSSETKYLTEDIKHTKKAVSYQTVKRLQFLYYQIPGNTGSIARTCAASAVGLHLVGPLGYKIEDSKLKRAGLDYWPYVVVKVHNSWSEFHDHFKQQDGEKRLLAFTKRGTHIHSDFSYKKGDWLVFGSETTGLPPQALTDCSTKCLGGGTIRIPMIDTYVRCLNLSVSVGIAVYEAARQLNYEQLQSPSLSEDSSERLFNSEDIFG